MSDGLFLDRNKVLKIFFTSILIYILLYLFFQKNNIFMFYIIRINYTILSFILFMILNNLGKSIDKYIYDVIRNFFIIISIIGLGCISIITGDKSMSVTKTYIYVTCYLLIFHEILLNYLLNEYYINKSINRNIILGIDIFSVVLLFTSINFNYNEKLFFTFKIIFICIQFILTIKLYTNIKKNLKPILNQSIINKECIHILMICFFELCDCFNKEILVFHKILELIVLYNVFIIFSLVIIKYVEKPYKVLTKILQKENNESDNLNLQILMKNKELKRLNIILKQKEFLNHTFFRFMPHPIVILNTENNRIIFVNKKFLELIEMKTSRQIINQKIKKYIEFMPDLEENYYDGILYFESKKKYLKLKFLANYTYDDRTLIVIEDNTYKVQRREMKKEFEEKKFQEYIRTQFLSSISHDLKTPINVIYSAIQLEQVYLEKNDIQSLAKYNSISRKNCISLIKLTNNLIDNSKIYSHYLSANMKKVNIVQVVEDYVMSYVDYVSWNGIELIFDTNVEVCILEIDVEFMGRIILNLIANAVKYTPKNGKVFVIIEENNDKVFIKVKDTGVGIKDNIKYNIFNRYTSDNKVMADARSGTGLGLFVVKRLIELQHGKVYLDEDILIGTSIVIELKKGEYDD